MASKNKLKILFIYFLPLVGILLFYACKKDDVKPNTPTETGQYGIYNPTAYTFSYSSLFSSYLPPMPIPNDNPMTKEGVYLGRKLFYEKMLSGSGNMACASCHKPEKAFSGSPEALTTFGGAIETRNTPAIINLGWADQLFLDGRSSGPALENQAFEPVVNPNEMHAISWTKVAQKLQASSEYPQLFFQAFGTATIDSNLVVKAIAQFERTLISDNSKMDRYLMGEATLTPLEQQGLDIFGNETGDCFHCHGSPGNPLWTDNHFYDIGLDASYTDLGRGGVTGNSGDYGKFRVTTLRNLVFTAPYMHDGRFQTLEEVVEFYSTGQHASPNIDPNVSAPLNPNFTQQEKDALVAFLKTLTDSSFVTNPLFQAP